MQPTLPRATVAHLSQGHSAGSTTSTPDWGYTGPVTLSLGFSLCSPFLSSWVTLDKSRGGNHDFDVIPQDLALCWWSQLYENCGARFYCPLRCVMPFHFSWSYRIKPFQRPWPWLLQLTQPHPQGDAQPLKQTALLYHCWKDDTKTFLQELCRRQKTFPL